MLRLSVCLFKIGHVGPQGIDASVKLRSSGKKMGHALIRRGVDGTTTLAAVSSLLHNVVTVHGARLQNLHPPGRAAGLFPRGLFLLRDCWILYFCSFVIRSHQDRSRDVYLLSPVPSVRQSGAAAEEMGNQMSDIPSASLCSDLSRPSVSKLRFVLNQDLSL